MTKRSKKEWILDVGFRVSTEASFEDRSELVGVKEEGKTVQARQAVLDCAVIVLHTPHDITTTAERLIKSKRLQQNWVGQL